MYEAKRSGAGRSSAFSGVMRARQDRRYRLEHDLRRALEEGGLELHYQPQISLADGRVTSIEALVRWSHPEFGPVPPSELVPLAEDCGLMVPLGRQVLRTACADLAAISTPCLMGDRPTLRVSVNVSGRQLVDPGLVSHVEAALVAAGLDGARLCLEMSESTLMDDAPNLVGILRNLRMVGVGLSIDDFGTGYSSLLYLKRLPITELKVAASIVAGLARDAEAQAIVGAVTHLGAALGLDVVAEGVEACEQEQRLKALGCPRAQGGKYAPPLPLPDLVEWLRKARPSG
jgi:EAL domain-containing protein (putative c-di-GMP-specific phosphodiesterase class I)